MIISVSPTLLCTEKQGIGPQNIEIFSNFEFVWEMFPIFEEINMHITYAWK
jgi:hypothetical protein